MAISHSGRSYSSRYDFSPGVHITEINVRGLFGQYSYNVRTLGRCSILYGENGVGKTNILTLLYHLLSPGSKAGHRSALAKINFEIAEVTLSNGIMVGAYREGHSSDLIRTVVKREEQVLGAWGWGERSASHLISAASARELELTTSKNRRKAIELALMRQIERDNDPTESEEAFLTALRENVPPIYLLAADRILRSDAVNTSRSDVSTHRLSAEDMVERGRQRALADAIGYASHTLYQAGLKATMLGRQSMHSIYSDLLTRIAARTESQASVSNTLWDTIAGLRYLSDKFDQYSYYGLSERINGDEIINLLHRTSEINRESALDVIGPYVNSLKEQSTRFDEAYQIIDSVIGTLNEFLFDKIATFNMGDGIRFQNRLGDNLEPSLLSSGEQQLVLLFCHIVTATDRNGIFIIDEPEISLNIKWQRKLVDALLQLDSSTNLQFILASHSMEILTKHRSSVIPLESNRI